DLFRTSRAWPHRDLQSLLLRRSAGCPGTPGAVEPGTFAGVQGPQPEVLGTPIRVDQRYGAPRRAERYRDIEVLPACLPRRAEETAAGAIGRSPEELEILRSRST